MDIREAIGPAYSGLEEAKADVAGMFGLAWLMDHGALPKSRSREYYASYVAGLFRTLRFGTGEAHGRAEMMEFNYLLESGAVQEVNGRYRIDFARMPGALAQVGESAARDRGYRRPLARGGVVREVRPDARGSPRRWRGRRRFRWTSSRCFRSKTTCGERRVH